MVRVKWTFGLAALLLLGDVAFPKTASAYIDPGSGSYVLQMAIAGLLVAGYTAKLYWKRIAACLARFLGRGAGNHDSHGK